MALKLRLSAVTVGDNQVVYPRIIREDYSMDKNRIFFCEPQRAYMSIYNCANLRNRPIGKAAAGAQPKMIACERCEMFKMVDKNKVPTVTLTEYLNGTKPVGVSA